MRIDKNIWIMIGLGSIIFHLYLIFSGLIPNLVSRPIHMAFAIPWIFLYSENDKKISNTLVKKENFGLPDGKFIFSWF